MSDGIFTSNGAVGATATIALKTKNRVAGWFNHASADALWVLFVFAVSASISWQGWKTIFAHDDSVPLIESATTFLRTGILPSRGVASNYSSLIPPGSVWLFIPGVLLFSDHRLFEVFGALLLHLGTLIGLFILVHLAFSRSAARTAVLLYALSPIGLVFASSLLPRGHPCFAVWLVVWTVRWHNTRDAKYLANALVTFAAGMYVFMELAPLVLVPLAAYYLYRPPLRTKWLFVAAAISLVMWFPYLRFEYTRDFSDMASLVFQRNLMPRDHGQLLCDQDLKTEVLKHAPPAKTIQEMVSGFVRGRPRAALTGVFSNFGLHRISWGRQPAPTPEPVNRHFVVTFVRTVKEQAASASRPQVVALAVAFVATLIALIGLKAHQWRWSQLSLEGQPMTDVQKIVLLAVTLPWAALVAVAETDGARRYLFIWPLQTVLLTYITTDLLARWTARAWARAANVALIVIVVVNPTVLARLEAWRSSGWAGADSDIYRAVDFVAKQVRKEGRPQAAIGFSLPWASGPADWQSVREGGDDAYHAVDPQYKIGLEVDYVLKQRFRITNSDRCPEGISAADDYAIARVGPDFDPPEYVSLRRRIIGEFKLIAQFGDYAVMKK